MVSICFHHSLSTRLSRGVAIATAVKLSTETIWTSNLVSASGLVVKFIVAIQARFDEPRVRFAAGAQLFRPRLSLFVAPSPSHRTPPHHIQLHKSQVAELHGSLSFRA